MIGVIDIGLGNVRSVTKALDYLGAPFLHIQHANHLHEVSGVIFPGVGTYAAAMARIEEKALIEPLKATVCSGKPFLGICLGMQVLSEFGLEVKKTAGLGLVGGSVKSMRSLDTDRLPHMGWNSVEFSPLSRFAQLSGRNFYFVHSFHFEVEDKRAIVSKFQFLGREFVAAVEKENVMGVQFHPEKSQAFGLELIKKFLATC